MQNNELHGVIVPIITPVDSDDRVDESSFRKVIRHVIDRGVHGLFVGGSAGEGRDGEYGMRNQKPSV